MQQGQGTQGALIVRWQQAPGQTQTSAVLERNLDFFQRLRQRGTITSVTLFADLEGVDYEALLQGDVEQLIDLVKQTDYRTFLAVSRASLSRFRVITCIAGTNGDAQEVLREIERAQQVAQQLEQHGQPELSDMNQQDVIQGWQVGSRQNQPYASGQNQPYASAGQGSQQTSGQARY